MKNAFVLRIILVVVLIAALGYLVLRGMASDNQVGETTVKDGGNFRPNPSNATFIIEEESVTLSDGRNETSIVPGSSFMEETILLDKFAYGDINADGKEDTVLFLARYGAGSGTFIYLAAFVSGPVTYRGSEAVFLGDRISPVALEVNNAIITTKYLDRRAEEPFAAEPMVSVSKQFVFRENTFQEWR